MVESGEYHSFVFRDKDDTKRVTLEERKLDYEDGIADIKSRIKEVESERLGKIEMIRQRSGAAGQSEILKKLQRDLTEYNLLYLYY